MERSVFDITLELQNGYSGTSVTVKRGDTHRSLRIRLTDGGRPYRPGEGCTAAFTAVKPDGTHLFNACQIAEDVFLYDLTPQTTAVPGELECELRLYGEDGALLTAAAFVLAVEDTVYADGDETVASTGEATALTKLLTAVDGKLDEMEAVLNNEASHATIDDAVVGGDAWSGKNIVDKLCPAFTESGYVAVCEPVEGYPLEVVSTINSKTDGTGWGSITLTLCGKNLFDFRSGTSALSWVNTSGTAYNYKGCAIKLPAGVYTIHAEKNTTETNYYINTVVVGSDGVSKVNTDTGAGTLYWGNESGRTARTITVAEGDTLYVYDGWNSHTTTQADEVLAKENIQLEAGSAATAYEPYQGQTFTADLSNHPVAEGEYNWCTGVLMDDGGELYQHNLETGTFTPVGTHGDIEDGLYTPPTVRNIPAISGTNYIYSDCGNTTVSGRADPKTLFENLTNAIIALGGAV